MNQPPEFFARLQFQRGAYIVLAVLLLAFTVLGFYSLAILVGDGLNSVSSWQETRAYAYVLALTIIGGVGYLAALAWALLNRPSLVDLARAVEDRHPELSESLSTAVEIQQASGGPMNQLHAALFRSVEERTRDFNFRAAILPRQIHPLLILAIVISSFIASNIAMDSTVLAKARFHYADLVRGEATGVVIEPGSVDAPRGSDLAMRARVNRWQPLATVDYRTPGGEVESFPMAASDERDFLFTWYALESDFAYRVHTPSLKSSWQTVTVFDPPEIDSIQIDIQPPAYTGEPALEFSQLLDLFAVEGSQVSFRLDVPAGVQTRLHLGDEAIDFEDEITVTAEQTTEFQFHLRNDEGRQSVTDRFLLEVKPDEPPTVAVIDPGSDTQARLDDIVPLEIYAADDFGLSRVEIEQSVSGLPRRPIDVFSATNDFPLENTWLPVIEIGSLAVEFGDIVTYFAKVWDNREPEPQVSRSEVYFIEVVEEIEGPDQEGGNSDGGQEGEREKDVDLRAIITELKRLIRLAYAVESEQGERLQRGSQELGAALGKVATETQGVFAEVGQVLANIDEGAPYIMFQDAIFRIVEAEELANANDPGFAISPMLESMSLLVRLEKYLQALFPPQPQGGGSGGESSSANADQQDSGESDEESSMSLAEMQEALEAINRLSDEQAAMNRRLERAAAQMGPSEREEMERMQEGLSVEAQELAGELERLRQGGAVRDALRTAGGQMEQAATAAGQGDSQRAGRSGFRARRSLVDAAGLLDERIRNEATGAIAGLAQQAERLSQGQAAAAAGSRGAAASEGREERRDALVEQQRELNREWDQLKSEMERLTGDLGEVFPEAAQALDQVARQADQQDVDRDMSRAANALLYGRFDRAAKSQSGAALGLEEIASQLDQAAGTLPGLSPAELRQLLERVAEARRQLAQSGPGETGDPANGQPGETGDGQPGETGDGSPGEQGTSTAQQGPAGQRPGEGTEGSSQPASGPDQGEAERDERFGRLGDSLAKAGRALQDDSLVRLGSELQATKGGRGDGDGGGITAATMLDRAARVLQEYLRREIGEQRMRFSREGGPPPEKYRELVEEYFRDLAEEPSR